MAAHAKSIQVLPEVPTGKPDSGFIRLKNWLVKPPAPKTLPRVIVSTDTLREMNRTMLAEPELLAALPVFEQSAGDLRDAWAINNIAKIEAALKAGDALTRESSQKAAESFNRVVSYVDVARGALRYFVERSQTALAPFNIDYASITPDKSKTLASFAPVAKVKRRLYEHLDFTLFGGKMAMEALSKGAPWYVAVAVAGTGLILNEINKSKMLRKLKELEGKLVVAAGAARDSFENTRTLLLTRVIPQYEALLDVIARLESGLAALQPDDQVATDTEARERAFWLACALVEGKHYLQMMGGD